MSERRRHTNATDLEWSAAPPALAVGLHVATLVGHLPLLRAWTERIVRARYQQSLLGLAWTILQPAATVAILSIVFTRFVHLDTGDVPYVVFSFVVLVPWTLLATAVTDMVNVLVDNLNLVTKVHFPREILPLASLAARCLDFAIGFALVVVLLVLYGVPFVPHAWLWLPLIVTTQLALMTGLGLAGAAANVFYRDVRHVLALGLQLWLYACPVLYPATLVPERLRSLYFVNPMAGILEAYRAVLLRGVTPDITFVPAAMVAVVALVCGFVAFKWAEPRFADVV